MTLGDQHVDETKDMYQRRLDKQNDLIQRLSEQILVYAGRDSEEGAPTNVEKAHYKIRTMNDEHLKGLYLLMVEQEGRLVKNAMERRMTAQGMSATEFLKQKEENAKKLLKNLNYDVKKKK